MTGRRPDTGPGVGGTRWLVTGASGLLGGELVAALDGHDVTATGRADLDLASPEAFGRVRAWADGAHGRPLVVLNAAAWTDVDGAESDPLGAAAANTDGPGRLADACRRVGATLVHVSTDYVFPGTGTRPYDVDDPTDPLGVYGRTKEAGERAVRSATADHYIVRTAWLYGARGRNFVRTIAALSREREVLEVVDDQRGCPTWSGELALGLVGLAVSGAPFGTYHCTGGGSATWFELARAVLEELGDDPDRVRPCDSGRFCRPAPRPAYSVLSGRSWTAAGLPTPAHWREQLHSAFRANRSSLSALKR